MTLPFHMNTPLLTSPEIGYVLIRHHDKAPSQLSNKTATIHFDSAGAHSNYGAYSTFTAAESAALQEAVRLKKERAILTKNNKSDPNFELPRHGPAERTASGPFRLNNEFEIRKVELCPPVSWWLPEPGCEDALFAKEDPNELPVINLPSPVGPPQPVSVYPTANLIDQYRKAQEIASHEHRPQFASTKLPLWSRRDEGPFRDPHDLPYDQEFSFVRRTAREEPQIIQIVSEQPEELAEEPEAEVGVKGNGHVIVNGKPEKEMARWYTVEGGGSEAFGPFTPGRRHSLTFPLHAAEFDS